MSYTPGKWKLSVWTSGRYTIESDNGQVCELNLIHGPGTPKENGERIVHAVNSYGAILGHLKYLAGIVNENLVPGHKLGEIDKAIAQAEGK